MEGGGPERNLEVVYPRCGVADENIDHIFRECPVAREVWISLNLEWVLTNLFLSHWEWFTWVFKNSSSIQCRVFCCSLWAIWTARNKALHEGKKSTGPEIVACINKYIKELEGCEIQDFTTRHESIGWCPPIDSIVKLNFNAAFDDSQAKLVSWVVARNASGEVLTFKTEVHGEVASSFAEEALACLQAMFLGKQMGFISDIIE
ncbi:hypothetical protein PVK06_020932 [Gossypium arboreum]|uniref:Reverse transcriptase zinc-binding domain-containing protein n=1 Tax=Gossypium arboreum TaxID=29729 RepID=A0ABR0PNM3_GOSAR|nr:hypothetical protein PVK06_020932 [Gossypium arboreum]